MNFLHCFLRAYLHVSRNDNAVTFGKPGVSVPIRGQRSLFRVLYRSGRNVVSKEVSVQVVFARNVSSGAHALAVQFIVSSSRFVRVVGYATLRQFWSVASVQRHANGSGTRHVIGV